VGRRRASSANNKAQANAGGHGHWNAYYDQTAGAMYALDKNDPNYDSDEDCLPAKASRSRSSSSAAAPGASRARSSSSAGDKPVPNTPTPEGAARLAEYKRRAVDIIKEYFSSGDVSEAVRAYQELRMPSLAQHFVKRAITTSLDHRARERELVAVLLCALSGEGLYTEQVERGFLMLLETVADLELDVPSAKTELSVFVARAVADDILPMDFLSTSGAARPEGERAPYEEVLVQATNRLRRHGSLASELSSVAEVYAHWGGGESELTRAKRAIAEAVQEYLDSSDFDEVSRGLLELGAPHFMHEAVKTALVVALERDGKAAAAVMDLLARLGASGQITSNQMAKGFARVAERLPDLTLDVPNAKARFDELLREAKACGTLMAPSGANGHATTGVHLTGDGSVEGNFKARSVAIASEFFVSTDTLEAVRCLREAVADAGAGEGLVELFVKRLVVLALDRSSRERELTALLLSALYDEGVDAAQLAAGYRLLVEAAADLSLDVPDAVKQLALFLARGVVDDVLPPSFVAVMLEEEPSGSAEPSTFKQVALAAAAHLHARHGTERVLQAWGGIGSARASAKHAIERIDDCLHEYLEALDAAEAAKCLQDLHVPFFMHEVVKRALTLAIEHGGKAPKAVLDLLAALSESGMVTSNQMARGFARVSERLPDLVLDVPGAPKHFAALVADAKSAGVLPISLSLPSAASANSANGHAANGANGTNGHFEKGTNHAANGANGHHSAKGGPAKDSPTIAAPVSPQKLAPPVPVSAPATPPKQKGSCVAC